MLRRLGIDEEEIDDLVFEDEETAPKEGIKWMALARVHTANFFSPQTFEQHMRIAWSPAKEIQFHHIEGNMFSIQCNCLGDWLKVEEGGPWLFRQNIVCIQKYDGFAPPETVDLNTFETWIQIHKLPVGYRNDALIKNLTEKKVGKVKKVEINVQGVGNFVRARVVLDVRKVLARFVSVSRSGQREIYQIKYEKMPKFCAACGFMGHTHLECGSGEHEEDKLKWGDFLKADWETWHGRGIGGGRGYGRSRGRGRDGMAAEQERSDLGRGRGHIGSWRHNALPFVDGVVHTGGSQEEELDDTAASPPKKPDAEKFDRDSLDNGAKRRLSLGFSNPIFEDVDNGTLPMVTDADTLPTDGNLVADMDRSKRTKKAGANSPSLGSAGSLEESVRSQ
jgi:hypothetical protein